MNTKEIKTIDVNAKEWFDRVNGNSYFSAEVTINFGTKEAESFKVPFQYGYGEQYLYSTLQRLQDHQGFKGSACAPLWRWCEERGIILRANLVGNCKKRDVVAFGTLTD